jgi:hypothetical protein
VKIAFKNIILLTIAFMFLVSATGVYLTVHYCNSEDTAALFLFTLLTEEPCEHHKNTCETECSHDNDSQTSDDNQCCDHSPTKSPPCCSDAVFYIAVDDDFIRAYSPETPLFNFIVLPESRFDPVETASISDADSYEISWPPGTLSGKELAFYNRQLIL